IRSEAVRRPVAPRPMRSGPAPAATPRPRFDRVRRNGPKRFERRKVRPTADLLGCGGGAVRPVPVRGVRDRRGSARPLPPPGWGTGGGGSGGLGRRWGDRGGGRVPGPAGGGGGGGPGRAGGGRGRG